MPWRFIAALTLVPALFASAPSFAQEETKLIIDVRVTDAETGAHLDQVKLSLVFFPSQIVEETFTDSTGRANFSPSIIQSYVVRAYKAGYQPAEITVEPMSGPGKGISTYNAEILLRRMPADSNAPGGSISARELSLPEGAVKEFHAGRDLLVDKKDAKGSIEHFQKAIAAFPQYYEAYYLLGMAQAESGDNFAAEASFRKAIELGPKFLDPYYPLAEMLIRKNQLDDAEKLLQAALALDDQSWKWPFELSMVYGKRAQWPKAIEYGQMALGRPNPATKVHLLMADLYSNSGDAAKAIAELEEFKKLDPMSPMMDRVDKALAQLRGTAAPDPQTTQPPQKP